MPQQGGLKGTPLYVQNSYGGVHPKRAPARGTPTVINNTLDLFSEPKEFFVNTFHRLRTLFFAFLFTLLFTAPALAGWTVTDMVGRNWKWQRHLEQDAGGQFHYPTMIEGADGRVHITYTFQPSGNNGKSIKHVEFDPEWVREEN